MMSSSSVGPVHGSANFPEVSKYEKLAKVG